MPYPNNHLYLTIHWTSMGADAEAGQCGLKFDNTTPATPADVADCAAAVSAMWAHVDAGIEANYKLSYLRLASLGTDGKYLPNSVSFDHIYAAPVPGGGGAVQARFPLQTALASTLTTAFPRGQAHSGRIYLPWSNNALGADYMWSATIANNRSARVATMITALNAVLGPCNVFSKGTKTSTEGAKHVVTGVKTGRRPDVQRRRAKQIAESYGSTSAVS